MRVSELTGAALDWAVAKSGFIKGTASSLIKSEVRPYSTEWAQGGVIIERERIDIRWGRNQWVGSLWADNSGMAKNPSQRFKHNIEMIGETPLIAAMRCYVASKLGDEVDVPEGL